MSSSCLISLDNVGEQIGYSNSKRFNIGTCACLEHFNQLIESIHCEEIQANVRDMGDDHSLEDNLFQWRTCIQRKGCCNRSSVFCIDCPGGCIYTDVLKEKPYSRQQQQVTFLRSENKAFPRWMTELPNNLKLSEMSIPGTHDSGAIDVQASRFAQTQSISIKEQLEHGIRILDIQCHHIDNKFAIYHGPVYTNLNFNDVLLATTGFLNQNPGETILMRIKEEKGENDKYTNKRSIGETLQEYITHYSKYFWKDTFLPTLGEARGKIIILDDLPKFPGFGPSWYNFKMQDDYELPGPFGSSHESQIKGKWKKAKQFFQETNDGDRNIGYINFLSAFGPSTPPYIVATGKDKTILGVLDKEVDGMNDLARKYLNPEKSDNDRAGWVMMDFPGISLIYSIIIRNQ